MCFTLGPLEASALGGNAPLQVATVYLDQTILMQSAYMLIIVQCCVTLMDGPWTQWELHSFVVASLGNVPKCLVDCCKSTTDVASRQRLHSASRHQLIVPWHHCTKFGRRAFSLAGPTACNLLPDYLREPPLSEYTFRRSL